MFDQLVETVILGLIQGLAEWLPISSTAHIKIAEHYLGLTATPFFNLILHLGSLIVVIFCFRAEIKNILIAFAHLDFKSAYGKMIPLVIVATIPTAIIGLIYDFYLDTLISQLWIYGATFFIGATLVYTSKKGKEKTENITYPTALLMGIAQGLAIFPGLSRSGATISTALLLGLQREKAFKFSFLLSIPAILGDTVVEAYHSRGQLTLTGINMTYVLIAVLISIIVGYLTLKVVSSTVRSRKFHYFAIYTYLLGATLIILTLTGHI